MAKILIVEDDVDLSYNIKRFLMSENHAVEVMADGAETLEHLRFYQYDLIVLDLMLPGSLSGLDVCKQYRASGGVTPILILTGKTKIEDKEIGLDLGADDYLTKPFHLRELSARLRALLRRAPQLRENTLSCGYVSIDLAKHKVLRETEEIHLLPKEYALLEFLMRHQEQVYSPEALLDRIWPSSSDVSPDSVRTYIARLRSKIDIDGKPSIIQNVHGVGYKMTAQ